MSNNQDPSVATTIPTNPAAPASPTIPAAPTPPSAPPIPAKPILPENTIGVRELKNQLTRIVSTVRNEQKEYVVTVHGQPVAVLRPYTEEDAITNSKEAFQRDVDDLLDLAQQVREGWASSQSPLEVLEQMREESACR